MPKLKPKQITVRGVSEELARRLKRLSASKNESLNATVLRILEDAVGIEARRRWLERWATWTEADVAQMEEALRAQRVVDPKDWL